MIIVKLMGGLGNQMFQYAAGRALALRHGTELLLDTRYFACPPAGETPRRYALGHLSVQGRPAEPGELKGLAPSSGFWPAVSRRIRGLLSGRDDVPVIFRERAGEFCPEVLSLPDNTCLVGYWQSESYFADRAADIRRELAVEAAPSGLNRTLASVIGRVEAVALHVRRGDYVSNPAAAAFHGQLDVPYYRRALEEIRQRVENPHLFVFSDDPGWARQALDLAFPATIVDHNPPESGHEDLRLMSLCRHAIIANSSFSWWGGWLIDNPAKVIVAPERWFSDPARQFPEMLPANWLQVAND